MLNRNEKEGKSADGAYCAAVLLEKAHQAQWGVHFPGRLGQLPWRPGV